MEKTAWRSSIIRQFSMKHHTHQHNSIKCNLTACATMWSVQQHFLPLKLWTGFFFFHIFVGNGKLCALELFCTEMSILHESLFASVMGYFVS